MRKSLIALAAASLLASCSFSPAYAQGSPSVETCAMYGNWAGYVQEAKVTGEIPLEAVVQQGVLIADDSSNPEGVFDTLMTILQVLVENQTPAQPVDAAKEVFKACMASGESV